jgi:uncharacterized membrane protein HdeD (DUF308 family)
MSEPRAVVTGRFRPAAIAGYLWLIVAGLLGLIAALWATAAPLVGLVYAVPIGLFGLVGFGLVTRRGLWLPLASVIMGTVLTITTLEAIRRDPSTSTSNAVALVFWGAIVVSSILAVWSAWSNRPRDTTH